MAKKVYIVELDARNKAALKKIQEVEGATIKASNRMEKSVNRIGKALIAAFSAQQVLNFMKSSIDAFLESEKVAKKLELQFGRTASSLQKYAKELQKLTVYEDDLIVQAMSTIGVFVKNEDVVKKLTRATLDLASAKGIDLLEAAELVTKSFVTNTNALKRQGFEIEGNAGSVERLDSLLKALSVTTGYAEDEAKSYTGQLQQMNNELNTQQEEIGEKLLPIWLALNKAIGFSVKTLVDAGKILKGFIDTGVFGAVAGGPPEKIEMMKTYTSDILRMEVESTKKKKKQTEELQKQYDIMEDIYERMREMDDEDTILGNVDIGSGKPGTGKFDRIWAKKDFFKEDLEKAQEPMSALVSLSNQMASNFSFAGHTFVGQLSQAIAMVDSISNMILTVASIFGAGGGGFGIGGLLSLFGLEKGGRVSNFGGNISYTKIPSFAMGGSYSTPGFAGPMGGGYPVMVHKNETLDVYNAGQTSRMENTLREIKTILYNTGLNSTRKRGGGGPIVVKIGDKVVAEVTQKRMNKMQRGGVNLEQF